MGTPPLSRELAQQAVDAVSYARAMGKSDRFASRMLGLNNGTMFSRLDAAKRLYGLVPSTERPAPELVEVPEAQPARVRVRVKAKQGSQCVTTPLAVPSAPSESGPSPSGQVSGPIYLLLDLEGHLQTSLLEASVLSWSATSPTSSTPSLSAGVARPNTDSTIALTLVIDGRAASYTVPRHVAAALVAALAGALV